MKLLAVIVFFALIFVGYSNLDEEENLDQEVPQLFVLSYATFNGLEGAGPEIKKIFEPLCGCRLRLINGGNAGILLNKMNYLPQVDIVLGLDQLIIHQSPRLNDWKLPSKVDLSKVRKDIQGFAPKVFVPFDWAPMSILFRQSDFQGQRQSWQQLVEIADMDEDRMMSLQNPRTSSAGMHFLWWLYSQSGLDKFGEHVQKLKPKFHSISPSWDSSYGLFQNEEVKFTFSYLTSLKYHWGVEKDKNFQAYQGASGHPFQIEYVGIPKSCAECELAEQFVEFLLTPEAQKILSDKNYMFSVLNEDQESLELPSLPLLPLENYRNFLRDLPKILEIWDAELQQI